MSKIIYSDKNSYGVFNLYEDHMEFSYKALGMGNAKDYYFDYEDIVKFEFISSGTMLYKFLHLILKDGKEYDFYISKKVTDEWSTHLNKLLNNKKDDTNTERTKEKKSKSYNVEVIHYNGKYSIPLETRLYLEPTAIRLDRKTEVINIPYNAILNLAEDHNKIIIMCNHGKKYVITETDYVDEIMKCIQDSMDEVDYDKNAAIEVADALGNVTYNSKKSNRKITIAICVIVAICLICFTSCTITSSNQETKAKECIAKIYPEDADQYSCKYSHIGKLVNCEDGTGLLNLQLYESQDGDRFIVRGDTGNGKYIILNDDCFGE